MVPVTVPPLDWVVDLANEFGGAPRAAAGEADAPYADLAALTGADEFGALPAGRADLVDLADRLHAVFAAPDTTSLAERLNALLDDCGLVPRVIARDAVLAPGWRAPDAARALAAGCAAALWQWTTTAGAHRLGTCAAEHCVDAYVDRSPRAQRRYCSSTCLTRTKVAAHRARRRAGDC